MRGVRLVHAVLAILTVGLVLAGPADAQPPSRLTDHITDSAGVLTDSSRAAVSSAIDRLYRDRQIQLWVVYVDNFSRFKPENWADRTRNASGLGGRDVLLSVATNTKLYALSVPPQVSGLTDAELDSLRSKRIEPAVGAKDWSGAAVAAADGLNKSTSSAKPIWLSIAISLAVVVVVVVVFLTLYRVRRRRAARRGGQPGIEAREGDALSTANTRLRQITDYVTRHGERVGAEAQARMQEAKRYLAAAHAKEMTNAAEAVAYANRASTLAAEAQTLANADVLAAHRRRGGGTAARR
ncbi:TPM domain-containing protein [Mycobacterium sp. HNNTM2301]|uniref:TPM domain-containing protein n=1 Tax=Mycobacterium hainanense TaxID=3289775 RepID=UPI0035A74291